MQEANDCKAVSVNIHTFELMFNHEPFLPTNLVLSAFLHYLFDYLFVCLFFLSLFPFFYAVFVTRQVQRGQFTLSASLGFISTILCTWQTTDCSLELVNCRRQFNHTKCNVCCQLSPWCLQSGSWATILKCIFKDFSTKSIDMTYKPIHFYAYSTYVPSTLKHLSSRLYYKNH